MSYLKNIITSGDSVTRDQAIDSFCKEASTAVLIEECDALEDFRNTSTNLYEKVRALFFLHTIYRYHLPYRNESSSNGLIPYVAYEHILNRRFGDALKILLDIQKDKGINEGVCSALADAYHKLGFQTLADQVKKSVRTTTGNNWMFRVSHPYDHPLHIHPLLLEKDEGTGLYPILSEKTPVRMDLSHSCWSDIFFLGMDFPRGARVLNISVDLCTSGNNSNPVPPIETYLRVIDSPVIRLISTDLESVSEVADISGIFDFARDYLGLLKAAIIASGIVPPAMEGVQLPMASLLERLVGSGKGLEIVSQVNNIPKGSRLAVSTNLLASLISLCMRATGQTESTTGMLQESERRLVAARAILGEWLGGSGGGWQDSGGVWPGIKIIEGVEAGKNDPEYGISKGRLLPNHTILEHGDVSGATRQKLQDSLVMVHGGMAQDVGPVLEMVTEKYLLRAPKEWEARKKAITYFDNVVDALKAGDITTLGQLTQENFDGPIQEIIPWASNAYTEKLIRLTKSRYGKDFWGFWMMGGMSGGGMGFIFDPQIKEEAKVWLHKTMVEVKQEMSNALSFAMDPVVYDFKINERGTFASCSTGENALLPANYYKLILPSLLKKDAASLNLSQRSEIEILNRRHKTGSSYIDFISGIFERILPATSISDKKTTGLHELLEQNGFNRQLHEEIKRELKSGRIGLAQNRLPVSTQICDVAAAVVGTGNGIGTGNGTGNSTVSDTGTVSGTGTGSCKEDAVPFRELGEKALKNGELAILTLAGGLGSRWTKGAGVVKSLHPFARFNGVHRNFIDIHLAKNKKSASETATVIPHIFTTSYLTHKPIADYTSISHPTRSIFLSPGQFIGQRLYPTERDLRFYWDEMPQQLLDVQAQKMRESLHQALINWAKTNGEAEDYTANIPAQCIHPVGHWFEIPNMLLNGTAQKLLRDFPNLKYLLIHNIDTLGANADPFWLGRHIHSNNHISGEVISRWLDDRGGGLANINGKDRLVEGLALPDERAEFNMSYYNTNTFWISFDFLLSHFGLSQADLSNKERVRDAVVAMAEQMPTYITLKEVKMRWGKGQEDIYPVTQFEKLWGDMTALPGVKAGFFAVPRKRGQQLKEVAQLDGWVCDGSKNYIDTLCRW